MSEIDTELQLYWHHAGNAYIRIMPDGTTAVIAGTHAHIGYELTVQRATGAPRYIHTDGTLSGVVAAAGALARRQLAEQMLTWTAGDTDAS